MTVFGSVGSIRMSITPVLPSTKCTLFHVFPPSSVLYTPRSSLSPYSRPRAPTHTTSGFFGWTRILPIWNVFFSPTFVHVFPPSVLLYTPSP